MSHIKFRIVSLLRSKPEKNLLVYFLAHVNFKKFALSTSVSIIANRTPNSSSLVPSHDVNSSSSRGIVTMFRRNKVLTEGSAIVDGNTSPISQEWWRNGRERETREKETGKQNEKEKWKEIEERWERRKKTEKENEREKRKGWKREVEDKKRAEKEKCWWEVQIRWLRLHDSCPIFPLSTFRYFFPCFWYSFINFSCYWHKIR